MPLSQVKLTASFRQHVTLSVLAILLFIITYLVLIALAVGLTFLSGYLGLAIILAKPMYATLLIGFGLIGMGVLVLIFLVKFLFTKHTVDRSDMIEVTAEEQPLLFDCIREIVREAGTDFPKKVYLSADVNAAVFYDSGFWSMFLPVRKNLKIGLGLVNAVTVSELKAILAHEFGHFSQRSMLLGSYVYNVNRVIYNMLFENEGFARVAVQWSNIHGLVAIFAGISLKIIRGIQWVLRRVYALVNLQYMRLSRDMEFHADAVAAAVTGSAPLESSLLRLDFANYAWSNVINFYSDKIKESRVTTNLYPQQRYLLTALGKLNELPFVHDFPQVSLASLGRFNKSKLVIRDQWASHPSVPDRIAHLQSLGFPLRTEDPRPAEALFSSISDLEARFTTMAFEGVNYAQPTSNMSLEEFSKEYESTIARYALPPCFNGYFDDREVPLLTEEELLSLPAPAQSMEELFSSAAIDRIYETRSLQGDLETIEVIAQGNTVVKTFDYDGRKYKASDSSGLVTELRELLDKRLQQLQEQDKAIMGYFLHQASMAGQREQFIRQMQSFEVSTRAIGKAMELSDEMYRVTAFMQESTPHAQIIKNLEMAAPAEKEFKAAISGLLANNYLPQDIPADKAAILEQFAQQTLIYFTLDEYHNDAVRQLFEAMGVFRELLQEGGFTRKKALLEDLANWL